MFVFSMVVRLLVFFFSWAAPQHEVGHSCWGRAPRLQIKCGPACTVSEGLIDYIGHSYQAGTVSEDLINNIGHSYQGRVTHLRTKSNPQSTVSEDLIDYVGHSDWGRMSHLWTRYGPSCTVRGLCMSFLDNLTAFVRSTKPPECLQKFR